MVGGPEVDVDGVEEREEREAPGDTVNDDSLAVVEELVDDGSEKQEVNERPGEAWSGGACGRNGETKRYQMRNAHGAGVT